MLSSRLKILCLSEFEIHVELCCESRHAASDKTCINEEAFNNILLLSKIIMIQVICPFSGLKLEHAIVPQFNAKYHKKGSV